MTKFKRRAQPPAPVSDTTPDATPDALPAPQEGIPPHVWATLQEAGEEAAQRLLELLQPHRFNTLAGSVQRALLDLALTRAYGLPVRRSVSLELSATDADAVAASLIDLRASLPERGANRPQGDFMTQDTGDT
jgi:hypothetical protein